MKHGLLQKISSLDPAAFEALTRHLGFASAACYRLQDGLLTRIVCGEAAPGNDGQGAPAAWPLSVPHSDDYTSRSADSLVLAGYQRPRGGAVERKHWPKAAVLYFPEQALEDEKVVFALVSASGKRLKPGELSGAFEALSARYRHILRGMDERSLISEASLREHIKTLGVDLHMLLDHEIRTPLASVSGYTMLLREMSSPAQPEAWWEYWGVVESQLASALEAIERLSLALASDDHAGSGQDSGIFDAANVLAALCREGKERAVDLVGADLAQKVSVRFQKSTDQRCEVQASPALFRWAIWEVIKNAIIHARSGRVDVVLYVSNSQLVIDVVDDGPGVSQGSEELVFLRFYQDPATQGSRRGKRGLGLGLFLARHLAERHLGQLTFVRQRNASIFRFLWPMVDASSNGGQGGKGGGHAA